MREARRLPLEQGSGRLQLGQRLAEAGRGGVRLDLDVAAQRFELSGGNIRSIAVTAAYFAAQTGQPVAMLDLMRATQREYRKLGRLCVESEFGPWYSLVMS